MKNLYTFLFAIHTIFSHAQTHEINIIRDAFMNTNKGEYEVLSLLKKCDTQILTQDPTIKTYKKAAEIMLLEYQYSPFEKIKIFKL